MKNKVIIVIPVLLIIVALSFIFVYKNNQSNETFLVNKSLFEAKIGEDLIFNNSNVIYVGKSEKEAKIDQCNQGATEQTCDFHLFIKVNSEASKKFAEITSNIETNQVPACVERDSEGKLLKLFVLDSPNSNCPATKEFSLNKKLDLYLDGKLFSSLLLSEGLKGTEITEFTLFGSGNGTTIEKAYDSTSELFEKLQNSLRD
jgi:hypothetical protein